ncbi:MAG: hypothetical protein GOMPHAMPRED_006219 [Gomphillus americanus]|uniref:Ras GEF n=1 Tax=Gomphillus americanus TaxID=1940652 RepID=A0A8H3EN53_9LECA|nr:MAG: hypothetical protein GOMPHAMPRED_006219 [Gomphillus americanus]
MLHGNESLKLAMPGHVQESTSQSSSSRRPFSMISRGEMTPPLTPALSTEDLTRKQSTDTPTFPTYLRAVYPFHPPCDLDSDTITLPLNQGNIILIHSIHSNGWADGTLLDTAHRGWLPTNYCEEFDSEPLRTLLNALTTFWDSASEGGEGMITMIHGHNLTQGLVAGVRCLLAETECLTRDQALLCKTYGHSGLRKYRKALLFDLSEAVKFFKTCEPTPNGAFLAEDDLNQLVLKTFKVIVRAVKFHDVWSQQAEVSDHSRILREMPVPPTPPSETTSFSYTQDDFELVETTPRITPLEDDVEPQQPIQKQSVLPRRDSSLRPSLQSPDCLYHRISWSKPAGQQNNRLASTRLISTNDGFLSYLAIFLSIHLTTQTSTEVLVATQQAVNAGRALLTVVEAVWDRGLCKSESLQHARDKMYKKITRLVHAAQRIFSSPDHDDSELNTRKHLSQSALSCVKGATECVTATRAALEVIGDFEFETIEEEKTDEEESCDASDYTIVQDFPLPPEHKPQDSPALEEEEDQSTPTHQSTIKSVNIPSSRLSVSSILQPPPSLTDCSSVGDASPLSPVSVHTQSYPRRIVNLDAQPDNSPTDSDANLNQSWSSSTLNRSQSSTTLTDSTYSLDPSSCDDDLEEQVKRTTHAHELLFNREGLVSGGTLPALVERLTTSDARPDHVFFSSFFLTFRLFTTPEAFARALVQRYHYIEGYKTSTAVVRLRVYNVFKIWMESNWRHESDDSALLTIRNFAQDDLVLAYPSASSRLLELVLSASGERTPRGLTTKASVEQFSRLTTPKDAAVPMTMMNKHQTALLKTWQEGIAKPCVTDFDPLEIARQLTIKASALFCSIQPEELLATEWTKKSSSQATNVRAMSTLSTDLTNLVADDVLQHDDHAKRAKVIKHWIKVASKCLELNNYDSLMAIVCSLNSTPVLRLKKTWESIGSKTKAAFEQLTSVVDVSKNYTNLRQRLATLVTPTLPFLGVYLTDLTFVEAGNAGTRNLPGFTSSAPVTAINFDKYAKTAKIVFELQRFQTPYALQEIPEFQAWLQEQLDQVRCSMDTGSSPVTKLYRRSCVLEPRASSVSRSTATTRVPQLTRTQSDFLSTYFK